MDGFVGLDVLHHDLAAHQLAAGDLAALQRYWQVNVVILEGPARRQVARRIDAAYERVQVLDLGARADLPGLTGWPAHLLGGFPGLEPGVDLLRQRAVRRHRDPAVLNVDVPFERSRAFGVRDGDRRHPVTVLVRREANRVVGIATAQEVD